MQPASSRARTVAEWFDFALPFLLTAAGLLHPESPGTWFACLGFAFMCIAGTLLGDPSTIILDEPANGLDPEGIRWIRDFLRHYADQGRTVLVSSHLLSEMSLMAQDLIVIGKGRLIQQSSVGDFVSKHASTWVRVRSPQLPQLLEAVNRAGATVKLIGDAAAPEGAEIKGLTIEAVGEAAHDQGIVLHELSGQTESLEDAFLSATADSQEYRSGGAS